jgi:hypothetical protein
MLLPLTCCSPACFSADALLLLLLPYSKALLRLTCCSMH